MIKLSKTSSPQELFDYEFSTTDEGIEDRYEDIPESYEGIPETEDPPHFNLTTG